MGRYNNNTRHPRGGRGRGRTGYRQPPNNAITKKKKTLEDYYFYVGSSKQASDFETTYEFLLNYIKRTYTRGNDIAEALRKMESPDTNKWKPVLQMSKDTDDEVKKREYRQYELDYKADYDEYMKRKRTLEENSYKAYAEVWARCNKAMQLKIES